MIESYWVVKSIQHSSQNLRNYISSDLLVLFPKAFRERYWDEPARFLELDTADIRTSSGTIGVLRFWITDVEA